VFIHSFIHSFCSLSYDRSVTSSKASSPQGAIQCFLFQSPVFFFSLRSSSSCLRLLPRHPVISILPSNFPSIMLSILITVWTLMVRLMKGQVKTTLQLTTALVRQKNLLRNWDRSFIFEQHIMREHKIQSVCAEKWAWMHETVNFAGHV
jgi:hypothetical protein